MGAVTRTTWGPQQVEYLYITVLICAVWWTLFHAVSSSHHQSSYYRCHCRTSPWHCEYNDYRGIYNSQQYINHIIDSELHTLGCWTGEFHVWLRTVTLNSYSQDCQDMCIYTNHEIKTHTGIHRHTTLAHTITHVQSWMEASMSSHSSTTTWQMHRPGYKTWVNIVANSSIPDRIFKAQHSLSKTDEENKSVSVHINQFTANNNFFTWYFHLVLSHTHDTVIMSLSLSRIIHENSPCILMRKFYCIYV